MNNAASPYNEASYQVSENLFNEHIYMAKSIAHHIGMRLPPGIAIDDLIQVGLIGLMEASRIYDPSLGATFKSYAHIRVRGAIIDELRRQSWIPRSVQKKSREISQAIRNVESREGRTATDREIADELQESLSDYTRDLEMVAGTSVFSASDDNYYESIESEEKSPFRNTQDELLKKNLTEVISKLPEQEKLVIALYYEKDMNLREISEVLEVSESRVCQIHSQAVGRIRSRMPDWVNS